MQVTLHTARSLSTSLSISFEPALKTLTRLFNALIETVSSCWGNRKAKIVEVPKKTEEKVDKTFRTTVKLAKQSLAESRFTRPLWDLARGFSQKDMSFIEENEKSLNEEEKTELRTHCKNVLDPSRALQRTNDKILFQTFLRKLDHFDLYIDYIKSILLKIQSPSTSREDLKMEIRLIRQYFINRSCFFAGSTGHDKGGQVVTFVPEFFTPLFGYYPSYGNEYCIEDGIIINNENINHGKEKKSGWVAGFTFRQGGHAVAYVRTKEGFVKFDNKIETNKICSIEEIYKLLSEHSEDVITEINFPLDKNLDHLPDAKSWVTPTWERNNCFAAASLMYLAIAQHYHEG